jgi:hypothetical protein
MPSGTYVRSFAARVLLVSAVMVVLAPIGVLLHEIDEHGLQDASHCDCIICHSSGHTPMTVEAAPLDVVDSIEIRVPRAPKTHVAPTLTVCFTVSGRSPPVV